MRLPGGVGEPDRQRRAERTEVAGEVRARARRLTEQQRRHALDQHHRGDPGEAGRSQPPRPSRAGRARAVTAATRLGHRFGGANADHPVDALQVGGELPTVGAVGEVVGGQCELVAGGLAVAAGDKARGWSRTRSAPWCSRVANERDWFPHVRGN